VKCAKNKQGEEILENNEGKYEKRNKEKKQLGALEAELKEEYEEMIGLIKMKRL
jgi:hypothetical protein